MSNQLFIRSYGPMVYCDFATQKVTRISFEELQVNDKVIMCIRSSEIESFRSGSTSYANSTALVDNLVRIRI